MAADSLIAECQLRIILSSTDYQASEAFLKCLVKTTENVSKEGDAITATWGALQVRPGAFETTFEIVAVVGWLGGFSCAVLENLIANWISSKISGDAKNRIRIDIVRQDGTRVRIDAASDGKITIPLKELTGVK